MPTVPSNFVPQVDMQGGNEVPLQAPGVEPVRNLAADQQVQLGEAMTRAGNVAWNVGSNIQDHIDEATAREGRVFAMTNSQELLRGKNGYLNMSGKDADTNYKATDEALSQIANNAMDTMKNETQKSMLKNAISTDLITYRGLVDEHRNKEAKTFFLNESTAHINALIPQAVNLAATRDATDDKGDPTGQHNLYAMNALAEVHKQGLALGIPIDSNQMKGMENNVWGQITSGVVDDLSLKHKFASAERYVISQNEKGRLDEKNRDSMLSQVRAGRLHQEVWEGVDSIMKFGVAQSPSGQGNYVFPTEGAPISLYHDDETQLAKNTKEGIPYQGNRNGKAMYINPQPGTDLLSPGDGEIVKIENGEKGSNITIKMYEGDNVVELNNVTGSVSELQIGQSLTSGEKITENGAGIIEWRMQRDGKEIDPRSANYMDKSIDPDTDIIPPEDLRQARQMIKDQISDPNKREMMLERVNNQFAIKHELDSMDTAKRINSAMQKIVNGNQLTPSELAGLPPQIQKNIKDDFQSNNDIKIQTDLVLNPNKLSTDYVNKLTDITPKYRLELLKESANPNRTVTFENDMLVDELNKNYMYSLAKPDEKDQQQVRDGVALREQLKNDIDVRQRSQGNKPLDRDQIKETIDNLILKQLPNTASVESSWKFLDWGNKVSSIGSMSKEEFDVAYAVIEGKNVYLKDIPQAKRNYIVQRLIGAGLDPSIDNIAKAYEASSKVRK